MKKTHLLFYILLFIFINLTFFNYSCVKDFGENVYLNNTRIPSTEKLKILYSNLNTEQRTAEKLTDELNVQYTPNWTNIKYEAINDSTTYSIVRLNPKGIKKGTEIDINLNNYEKFILFKNDTVAYIGTFTFTENSKSEEEFLKNGNLTLENLLNGYSSFYIYSNGKATVKSISEKKAIINNSKSASTLKTKSTTASSTRECEISGPVETCKWMLNCSTGPIDIMLSPVPGTCIQPPSKFCGGKLVDYILGGTVTQIICTKYKDPNPPGGGGGVSGQQGGIPSLFKISGLNDKQKEALKYSIEVLNSLCVDSIMLVKLKNSSITIVIQDGKSIYRTNKTFTLDDGNLSSFNLFRHELFHAIQHQLVIGADMTKYGIDNGVPQPGYINIEFEQVVNNDLIKYINEKKTSKETGNGFARPENENYRIDLIEYTNFIDSLGSKLLDKTGQFNAIQITDEFDKKYFHLMEKFKIHQSANSYGKSEILRNLKPLTLKYLYNGQPLCPPNK